MLGSNEGSDRTYMAGRIISGIVRLEVYLWLGWL